MSCEERGAKLAQPTTHVIELDAWPPSVNRHCHPLQRYRLTRPVAEAVAWQAKALGLAQPYPRARVVLTWLYPRTTDVQDMDNAWARAKPLVDALKGIAIVDDDPAHVDLVVRQQHVASGGTKRRVRLEIEDVSAKETNHAQHTDDD